MRRALGYLDNFEEIVGGAFFIIIVVTTFLGVVFRYLLNDPIPWTIELATICFVWVVFLGSSSAMKRQLHIGIDAVTKLFPQPIQEVLGLIVNIAILWLLWFFIHDGWNFSIAAWMKITPVFKWPYTVVDLAVPVGSTLMAIRVIQQMVVRVRALFRVESPAPPKSALRRRGGPPLATTISLVSLLVLFLSNMPVAFAIALSTYLYFHNQTAGLPETLMLQRMISGVESFPLLAVPFFVMAGSMMNYAGISNRILGLADALTGHMVGGLAQVNVVASTLAGGLCGSANADAAWEAKALVPEMVRRGYSLPFSAAVTASSALISPIIPPGIGLIIFGFTADVSIGKLFMAGIVPGLLMTVALMVAVDRVSRVRGYRSNREKRASAGEIWKTTLDASWALAIPIAILGGIRFGMFTPTEAGAMAVVYSVFIGAFAYKELKWSHATAILQESLNATAVVMLIVAAAAAFGWFLSYEQIPQQSAKFLTSLSNNPLVLLLILNVALLFVGMFVEGTAALIILTPILMPTITQLGIDPVHFGIIMVVNLTIGSVTHPLGTVMYTTCSITGAKVDEFTKENMPLLAALIVALLLLTMVPEISLFLPRLLMG